MGSPQVILIDTHILLWWMGGERRLLSAAAKRAIDAELDGGTIYISSASAWEIAVLVARGRIGLSLDVADWLATVEAKDAVRFVPLDNEIALRSVQLGDDFHKDPGDRFIVATSQKLGVPLVTADKQIRSYRQVRTIW
jgi:PIN domain nuclease of toxin-antitoxin system